MLMLVKSLGKPESGLLRQRYRVIHPVPLFGCRDYRWTLPKPGTR